MNHRLRLYSVLFAPVAIIGVTLLLYAISPWRQPGPVIRLLVGPERSSAAAFDSQSLVCPDPQVSRARGDDLRLGAGCAITIHGKLLTFQVRHHGVVGTCTAMYDSTPLACESVISFYNSHLPSVFVRGDLGLDPTTLRYLPGINPVFYVTERDWFWVHLAVAALIVVAAMLLFAWSMSPAAQPALVVRLAHALGYTAVCITLFGVVWYVLLFVFLSSGLVD
ncbi:MAG: hypothetical protein H7Y32_08590 [Chloroflexales bacterium]|nr:hypothetical protein [Chloroflexales bacterium]